MKVIDYQHKYNCLRNDLANKRRLIKSLREGRDKAFAEVVKLRRIIQNIENEVGDSDATEAKHDAYADVRDSYASDELTNLSEQTSSAALEIITHTGKIYCDICPNELTDEDIEIGCCTSCGSSINLEG